MRKPVLAPGGGRPRGSTVNSSDPRRKYKEARERGIEAMQREGKVVPAESDTRRPEANGFDQEVKAVLDQMMLTDPEMDMGTARGQAVKVVKERRRAREVEEARAGLVPIALEPVGSGGIKLTPAELAKRLGVKLGKEVE
jgi:hypothetical protein